MRTAVASIVFLLQAAGTAGQETEQAPRGQKPVIYGGSDNSPPYHLLDKDKGPQGFTVDLIRALSRTAGRPVEIRLGNWREVLDEVAAGRIDLVALAQTEKREERFTFLDEVWTVRQAVLFLPGRRSYPSSLLELATERVAVQTGTLTEEILLTIPEAVRPVVVPVRDQVEAIRRLQEGDATAVAGNALVLQTELARLGVRDVREVVVKANSYRLATAKGREAEMAWIGPALQQLRDSGEFARIVEAHLAEPRPQRTFRDYLMGAAAVAVVAGIVIAVVLGWNVGLKRQVASRTAEIAQAAAEKEGLAHSLAEREQRMRMIAEQIPAVLWSLDRDLVMTSASGLGLRTLQLDANRMVGSPVGPILNDLGMGGSPVMEHLIRALDGDSSDVEIQIRDRDFEIHIEPLRDSAGRISGVVGLTLDVTERRRAARAVRESDERYRAFLERSTEGIWRLELGAPWPKSASLDEQMAHLYQHAYVAECNDAMARLYGLTRASELKGRLFGEVRRLRSHLDDVDVARTFVAHGFEPTAREASWRDEAGRTRWSASVIVGILDEGALLRAWATEQDITARKEAEGRLHDANRLLEIKNAELERFTYTVSHDLRSPLITIRGYLGHLEASFAEGNVARFQEDAARIRRATEKMDHLLKDLLELSRVGRVLSPHEDVPMGAVAKDAIDLVSGPITERGVAIEIPDGLPTVRGDRRRLTEVLQNLVENAVKFMGDQPAPRIRISARGDALNQVVLVEDNGVGIEACHHEKIFGLFEKLSAEASGTGVGLALVRRIIEAHGGRAWVESGGAGLGSTFCFSLPRAEAPGPPRSPDLAD